MTESRQSRVAAFAIPSRKFDSQVTWHSVCCLRGQSDGGVIQVEGRTRRAYIALWVFAVAFGWMEAATVVYLRATSSAVASSAVGVQFPFVLISERLVAAEIVREASTMLILGAVAWLAARRWAGRVGAFLFVFGVWDLAYYVVLRLISGWPQALTDPDILFLIPWPWVGPVWAPAVIAAIFVAAGSYLYWSAERARQYTPGDLAILIVSAAAIVASFLVEWRAVLAGETARDFRPWLYWIALALGAGWFVRAERRRVLP
jgi:hypothetical protein